MGRESQVDEAIRKVIAGESEAFSVIVDAYGPRVIAFCRVRLQSEEDARDAAQEVFIRAWTALGGFRLGESFAAWLFAIAANHVRSRFRILSFESRKTAAAANEIAVLPPSDPIAEAEERIRFESLGRAVAGLPSALRVPVELFYFAGLSVSDTAGALGLGEEAVKSRLFRARGKLRAALERVQPTRPSGGILP